MFAASLASGTRLGPYQVVEPIGAGGMGEVYRAHDTRLGRDVAVKVLAGDVANDTERRSRFEREARAVAALDHPHICGIYDVGTADGTHYLVMPLLDGQTLAARLERGALPLDQALTIATEIADALDKAHRHGIVHRDLKPANVMLTRSGARLLDFGLAKLRGPGGPVAMSGTHTAATEAGTARGTILGTLHYMAPEQVEGKDADARSDIWALGAVLYEMVSGDRPFQGTTPASVIGSILKDEPSSLSARIPALPPLLARLVTRCLAKDPEARWQSAADLAEALQWIAGNRRAAEPLRSHGRLGRLGRAAAVLAVGAVAGAAVMARLPRRPAAEVAQPAEVVRFQLTLPPGLTLVPEQPPAVSPDGRRLALVAVDRASGRRQIYVRAFNSVAAQPLGDTFDAQYPFWSADGTRLAFFARTRLKVVELAAGGVIDVAPVPNPGGPGVWMGEELLFPVSTGPISRVALNGGAARRAAPFDPTREANQSLVGILPDGRVMASSQAGLFLATADGASAQLLSSEVTMPAGLFPGVNGGPWLLTFLQNGRLMAQRVDPATGELRGVATVVAQEASRLVTQSARPFSSGGEALAFVSRSDVETRPTWVDRQGTLLGPVTSLTGQLRDIRLSPDGKRLSISRFTERSTFELLVVDLQRDTATPLLRDMSFQQASWTADGHRLVGVGQTGAGGRGVYMVSPEEGAAAELVLKPTNATPNVPSFSADGQRLCYTRTDASGDFSIYMRDASEAGDGQPLVDDAPYEASCRISPDGRWFAYHSNETGVLNVFLRSFPDGRNKQQISVEGGQRPAWRADGRELYYLAPDGGLIAVAIEPAPALKVGARSRLFFAPVDPSFGTPGATLFDPAADGQRFAMLVPTTSVPQPITVILNWRALLPAP
jgi:Tol biopolymer transport system component